MAIILLYGINSSGKDAVSSEISGSIDNCIITGESRLLMYHLGLIPDFGAGYKVEAKTYKELEKTDSDTIEKISNVDIPRTIKSLKRKGKNIIVLSHLVYALFQKDQTVQYLTERPIPSWICQQGDYFIYLNSPSADILERRIRDKNNNIGKRKIQTIKEIKEHQKLSDIKWEELKSRTIQKNFDEQELREWVSKFKIVILKEINKEAFKLGKRFTATNFYLVIQKAI